MPRSAREEATFGRREFCKVEQGLGEVGDGAADSAPVGHAVLSMREAEVVAAGDELVRRRLVETDGTLWT